MSDTILSFKLILAILMAVSLSYNSILSCPIICTCKWKGGKRRVECINKGLTIILAGISSETQVLDYSQNQLRNLPAEVFQKENLINLQKLYLSNCQISQIHDSAFQGLANLIELDLSNNMLSTIPFKTFPNYPLLMKLSLAGNPIRKLKSNYFVPLSYLVTLDISNCHVEEIEKSAFNGLNRLQWLKLNDNRLQSITKYDIFPSVSSGISLDHNRWKCDCNLRIFLDWLMNSKAPVISEIFCEEPASFRMVPIRNLKKDDLACFPYIVPSSTYVEIEEGKNVSFACQVSAIPEATIFWEFEGTLINNNTSVIYPFYKHYADESATEKISELFISDAKKQNNGTYKCVAKNTAGISSSNFTVRILYREKVTTPEFETISYIHILLSSIVTLGMVLICATVTFSILYYKRLSFNKTEKNRFSSSTGTKTIKLKNCEYSVLKKELPEKRKIPECGGNRKSTDINPDLISNMEENVKVPKTGEIIHNENNVLKLGENAHVYASKDAETDCNKLYYKFEIDGRHITLHLNPLENQIGLSYPCGCFYPIINENGNFCNVQNFAANVTEENKHFDAQETNLCFGKDACGSSNCELISGNCNLRYNLEGYPFPRNGKATLQRLDLKSFDDCSSKNTPILSPPEPFKSDK